MGNIHPSGGLADRYVSASMKILESINFCRVFDILFNFTLILVLIVCIAGED